MDIILSQPIPPLRGDLEMSQSIKEGEPVVIITDFFGLDETAVAVSPVMIMIASFFDGKKKAADIAAKLVKEKVFLKEADIQAVADELRKCGLLETQEAREKRRGLLEEFRSNSLRRSLVRLRGLPEDPLNMGVFLGKFFNPPEGPGAPGSVEKNPPVGLVAPHIDFFRGGSAYAWAYKELAERRPPDVIVALGVAHISPKSPWVMTKKTYETPFGPMIVDEDLYKSIHGALWYDPLEEEWVHAKEHSLEFQAYWLKHIWRDKSPKWVPILTSAFERFCADRAPSTVSTLEDAHGALGRILSDQMKKGRRIMVLAGVDLAHVGRRFGDDKDITPEVERDVENADRKSLESALTFDADSFFMSGVGDGAWRKICGLSALYSSLRLMKNLNCSPGKMLSYGRAPDPAGGIVSFVSAVFDESPICYNPPS